MDAKKITCTECGYTDEGHTEGADSCPNCGGSMVYTGED